MCGRFTLHTRLIRVAGEFGVDEVDDGLDDNASYNIAPAREVAVISARGGIRGLHRARWGITPVWDASKLLFNARAEGVAGKASFREAFKTGRCVVVADGFFEWKQAGKQKVPYYFQLASGAPMGFAGILTLCQESKKSVRKECAIITTGANSLVSEVHSRMPVILPSSELGAWFDPEGGKDALMALMRPLEPGLMKSYEVGAVVGDSPGNIEPVAA